MTIILEIANLVETQSAGDGLWNYYCGGKAQSIGRYEGYYGDIGLGRSMCRYYQQISRETD